MLETIISTANGIIAVIVVLGACIFFHELGHFAVAKFIGMRVNEFAIGFGRRLLGFTRGETEYRINLVPLGGYVRIAGMEPGAPPEERGFYLFPRWQGAFVLFAGSFMNVVLAAFIFIIIAVASGLPVFPGHTVTIRKVLPNSPAAQAGLQRGDRIVAIDGITDSLLIEEVDPAGLAARAGLSRYTEIFRANNRDVGVPSQLLEAMLQARASNPAATAISIDIGRFDEDGKLTELDTIDLPIPAELPQEAVPGEAGPWLERTFGMRFVPLGQGSALSYISAHAGQPIVLTVLRNGRELDITVVPRAEWARVATKDEEGRLASQHQEVGRIGVVLASETRSASLPEAVYYGVQSSIDAVRMVTAGLYQMVRGRIAPEASGPIGIAAITADRARIGWTAVASIGGVISANLAVINLFPIPPFDGFRIVLLAIEGIIRRRVNEKIEIGVTIAGIAVVLGFFLVVTFRDILNLVFFQTP